MKVLTWANLAWVVRCSSSVVCGAYLTRAHRPPTRKEIDYYLFLRETSRAHSLALRFRFVPCVYRVCRYTRRESRWDNPLDQKKLRETSKSYGECTLTLSAKRDVSPGVLVYT